MARRGGDLVGLCWRTELWLPDLVWPNALLSRYPLIPVPPKALPWTFASGRSIWGTFVVSFSNFCSRASILLFLTRDAFCKRSMDWRRLGDVALEPYPPFSLFLFCQNSRGEAFASEGELWNGEESAFSPL